MIRDYFFALVAVVGVALVVVAVVLHAALGGGTDSTPVVSGVVVTDSVAPATWAPYGTYPEPTRMSATAAPTVPPDPGHGPVPVCWDHPGQGLAPGATCPPKPR